MLAAVVEEDGRGEVGGTVGGGGGGQVGWSGEGGKAAVRNDFGGVVVEGERRS